MLKKMISIMISIIIIIITLLVFPVSVNAAEDENVNILNCVEYLESFGIRISDFHQSLENCLYNSNTSLNIENYQISPDDRFIQAVKCYIECYLPEYYLVIDHWISYYYVSVSGKEIIKNLKFKYEEYCDTAYEMQITQERLKEITDKLLDGIRGNDSLSEVDKALLIHDRLALHVDYDYPTHSGENPVEWYRWYGSGYEALFIHRAVCGGYAEAYELLMNLVGIKTIYFNPAKMAHALNISFIDNVPYFVDVTWDDSFTGVKHTNFLRSAEGIIQTQHTLTNEEKSIYGIPINDTTYDNYYWQKSYSAFAMADNKLYYIDGYNGTVNKADRKNTVIYRMPQNDSDASLCEVNNHLIFSCMGKVYKIDTLKDKVIPGSITSLDDLEIDFLQGDTGDCIWTLDGSTLTINGNGAIGDYVFLSKPLRLLVKKATISNGVTRIGWYAFCFCSGLTNIEIPDSVTSIGNCAFYECTGLTSITIPDSVIKVGEKAFCNCNSLRFVSISNQVTDIKNGTFTFCQNLKSIIIPNSVTNIDNYAFQYCTSLTKVSLPEGLLSISEGAFANCTNLNSITIPKSVTEIKDMAFMNCRSLASVNLLYGLSSIGYGAFYNCNQLTNVIVPDSVTEIEDMAFPNSDKFKLYGYAGSQAESFAKENGVVFVRLGKDIPVILGDVDMDGEATIIDATMIQRFLTNLATITFNEKTADTDKDGEVSIIDATFIQRFATNVTTPYPIGKAIK